MLILAMFSTVILKVWMGFFTLGSLPLLVLKHDTPLDARFIRGLFDVYYLAVMFTSTVGAVAFALAQRYHFALVFCAIGVIGVTSRRFVLSRMDRLRATMTPEDATGIRRFRALHIGGMAANFAQLMFIAVGMTKVSL